MNLADRIADLSMIWKQTSDLFPYFDRKEIDWDKTYREYLAKVMEAETETEFHLLLAEFINLLGDGHTDYIFPKALRDEIGYLPFLLRSVQDAYCIIVCIPEYQEFYGAEILAINGRPFREYISEASRYSYHVGDFVTRINQILPFLLRKTGNQIETNIGSFSFDLLYNPPDGARPCSPELPLPYQRIASERLDIRLYEGEIFYVKLDDFLSRRASGEVRAAMEQTSGAKGMILDLRENIGGNTRYGADIAELLIPGEFHACNKHTRSMTGVALAGASQIARWSKKAIEEHIAAGYSSREEMGNTLSYITNTHFDRYIDTYGSPDHTALFSGPCVILTSRYTVSAAEDFLAMFRTNKRAVIVGTETSGTSGTPLLQKLQCGGSIRVCSVGYQLLDGTEFIGCGIKPDIYCEPSAKDLQRGYDTVLDKGLSVLRDMIGN